MKRLIHTDWLFWVLWVIALAVTLAMAFAFAQLYDAVEKLPR